jgi:hypothetical protein
MKTSPLSIGDKGIRTLNDINIVSSNNIAASSSNDLQKPKANKKTYVSDIDTIKDALLSVFDEVNMESMFLEVMEGNNFEFEQAILNSKEKRNRDGTIKGYNFIS